MAKFGYQFQQLRLAYTAEMSARDAGDKVVRDNLGHSSISTTGICMQRTMLATTAPSGPIASGGELHERQAENCRA
jgi:hypothetical protein